MNDDTGLTAVQADLPENAAQVAAVNVPRDEDCRPDKLLHLIWQILRNGDMARRAAWMLVLVSVLGVLLLLVFMAIKAPPVWIWTFTSTVIAGSTGLGLVGRWFWKRKGSAAKEPKDGSNP